MSEISISPFYRPSPPGKMIRPGTIIEAADAIRSASSAGQHILTRGGGTKWSVGALSLERSAQNIILEMRDLCGVIEYDPGELTITAYAGTRVAEIATILAQHGQYLPFDPLFVASDSPATLGGTVAAGLSGPRRLRYGGLRDFIIGIHYLNADGTLIKAGGKVVKNAAGYDFPKLFCGSLGTLGVLTQVSFKVFPVPQASQTLVAGLDTATQVQTAFQAILRSKIEVSAADAWVSDAVTVGNVGTTSASRYTIAVQVDGIRDSLMPRLDALQKLLPVGTQAYRIDGDAESALWIALRDLTWLGDVDTASILRLSLPPDRLAALDAILSAENARTAYSLGGNVAWSVIPGDPARLSAGLTQLGAQAIIWRSSRSDLPEIIPTLPGKALVRRVKQAFDPLGIFYPGRYTGY